MVLKRRIYGSSSNILILGQKPEVEIWRPKNISFVMGLFWQKAGFSEELCDEDRQKNFQQNHEPYHKTAG